MKYIHELDSMGLGGINLNERGIDFGVFERGMKIMLQPNSKF